MTETKKTYLQKKDGSVEEMGDPYEYEGYGSTGHRVDYGGDMRNGGDKYVEGEYFHEFRQNAQDSQKLHWNVVGMFTVLELWKRHLLKTSNDIWGKSYSGRNYGWNDLFIKDQNFKA